MPDYFFHVAIELFPDPVRTELRADEPRSPNLSEFFKALKPFTNASSRRMSRDIGLDRTKDASPRRARPPDLVTNQEASVAAEMTRSDPHDHRLDHISLESSDITFQGGMADPGGHKDNMVGKGIGSAISGHHMKGRYEPLVVEHEGAEGWGIVHLYRDADETSGLYKDSVYRSSDLWADGLHKQPTGQPHPPPKDEECTSLCILAVPSYMTPSDFLAFVGDETRNEVSHFRMVRTSRANRYMVLMKFRHGKKAREWQHEWNGKVFNTMEPETCHVVFLKSVELIQTSSTKATNELGSPTERTSFPRMSNDPFVPATTTTGKPLAPRTSSLVELPTCPVCLERMDETTGLLTIPCQHVFHCTCLQKWSGGGCPVCRYTHDDFSSRLGSYKYKSKNTGEYEISDGPLECETCHADTSLWQCLICGKIGCGRYEGKHAYAHFEETGHTFSMDLESKRVWDYAGDGYVHRIIQDAAQPGEKLVELPGRRREPTALEGHEDLEMVKMENIALEYTHLLTSQLESQRVYFEEVLERAVDKAAEAGKRAERAMEESRHVSERLRVLESEHDLVAKGKLPELEKEKARLERRSAKFEEMARSINQKYLEEKTLTSSLMERVKHLEDTQVTELRKTIQQLQEESATKDLLMEGLREEHRDAMMQISAQRKLQEMVANGEIEPADLENATIMAGPAKQKPLSRNRKGQTPSRVSSLSRHDRRPSAQPSAQHSLKSDDDLAKELYNGIAGTGTSNLERGSDWNSEKAQKVLEECRLKLIEDGLLVAVGRPAAVETDGSEADGEDNAEPGKTSKKRKGKRRARK